ncbi:MAG: MFS transporter [Terrimonas sp.]|nr:MFS transporter [Terrimonas sp.]
MQSLSPKKDTILLYLLSLATFIIFFQLYMVAPLIPELSASFEVSEQNMGLIIPVFLIPYACCTLFYGILADKFGNKVSILTSFFLFGVFTLLTATSKSINQLFYWRMVTGIVAGGVVPIALAWIGQLYIYEKRGRPLGFIFGAIAGGGAFGSASGIMLEAYVGWKLLFLGVGFAAIIIWVSLFITYSRRHAVKIPQKHTSLKEIFSGYKYLLTSLRGRNTFSYVFLNGVFIYGVFTWLGSYLDKEYSLNTVQIGLALLGYGIPGFIFGPFIGKLADKFGRSRLLPIGLLVGGFSAFALIFDIPLTASKIAIIALSIGYDLSQPLLAGIITEIGGKRGGQAMSLMVFMLFLGFGTGSYLFGLLLRFGFPTALLVFFILQMILSLVSFRLFKYETRIKFENK